MWLHTPRVPRALPALTVCKDDATLDDHQDHAPTRRLASSLRQVGEKMLFRCLARFWSCCKHEVFSVASLQDVMVAFLAVKSGFEAMAESDPSATMTEVSVPSRAEYLDTQHQKRVVRGIVARIVKRVLKEQERLEKRELQMRGRMERQGARVFRKQRRMRKCAVD